MHFATSFVFYFQDPAVQQATPVPDAKLEVKIKLESKPANPDSPKVRVKRTPTKDPFKKFLKTEKLSKAVTTTPKPV